MAVGLPLGVEGEGVEVVEFGVGEFEVEDEVFFGGVEGGGGGPDFAFVFDEEEVSGDGGEFEDVFEVEGGEDGFGGVGFGGVRGAVEGGGGPGGAGLGVGEEGEEDEGENVER